MTSIVKIKSARHLKALFKKSKGNVVMKFFAPWCVPCKKISHLYKKKAKARNSYKFCEIDVDDFDDIVGKYKVKKLPTILEYENSVLKRRTEGLNEVRAIL